MCSWVVSRPHLSILCYVCLCLLGLPSASSVSLHVSGGSEGPLVVEKGADALLPCFLSPPLDASHLSITWHRLLIGSSDVPITRSRPLLGSSDHRLVYARAGGEETIRHHHAASDYSGRAAVSVRHLRSGNLSLLFQQVALSDSGTYQCTVRNASDTQHTRMELQVRAIGSDPVILTERRGRRGNRLYLRCVSSGWFPPPAVHWLDEEGRSLVSAKSARVEPEPGGTFHVERGLLVGGNGKDDSSSGSLCQVRQMELVKETYRNHNDTDWEEDKGVDFMGIHGDTIMSVVAAVGTVISLIWYKKRRESQGQSGNSMWGFRTQTVNSNVLPQPASPPPPAMNPPPPAMNPTGYGTPPAPGGWSPTDYNQAPPPPAGWNPTGHSGSHPPPGWNQTGYNGSPPPPGGWNPTGYGTPPAPAPGGWTQTGY